MSQAKEKKKKSGGFQSMGLSYDVLKGVLQKGYKVPTPIQRKTVPIILEGKDVVAMARTGSGKTAAFLVPMFEKLKKLKAQNAKAGVRALIFSPTRELAMQTMKFNKELGKYTGLKTILVLGGEKMEDQFSAIHENPDVIIATPGRFLHVVMEMDLKLSSVEYLVFDEADRLFEMGFQEQIQEVLHRLPEHRQTLLFSATLPRVLVDFVKAGLNDPVLIRLDVGQLSENLKTAYLCCRSDDKPHILIRLLHTVVDTSKELTVVFLATKHHVEYIKEVLERASIPCSYIYSSLDQMARKINVAKFKNKKVGVLLVTDIAARGIDIPLLDNVINYNFPSKPKLFVHRVGRVARAGRAGNAYSLVGPDEIPYLLDLHLFLGKPIKFSENGDSNEDGLCGYVPQALIDEEADTFRLWHETSHDLRSMAKVCCNAYKQYVKTRPLPSNESVKRVKEISSMSNKYHPIFNSLDTMEVERNKMLSAIKNYRPNRTIFEIGTTKNKGSAIIQLIRHHRNTFDRIRSLTQEQKPVTNTDQMPNAQPVAKREMTEAADDSTIKSAFKTIVTSEKNESKGKIKKVKDKFKDDEYYIPYFSKENYSEKGLGLQSSFDNQASGAVLDLMGDDTETSQKLKNSFRWDRKRKRFVRDDGSEMQKKMKTESGMWIPKSYKTDLYKKWKEKSKVSFQENDSEDDGDNQFGKMRKGMKGKFNAKKKKYNRSQTSELKSKDQILKERKRKSRLLFHQKKKQNQKRHNMKHKKAVNRKR